MTSLSGSEFLPAKLHFSKLEKMDTHYTHNVALESATGLVERLERKDTVSSTHLIESNQNKPQAWELT